MAGVLEALRAATREAHVALDASLDPDDLFGSRERYADFLVAMHGFHASVEERLGGFELDGVERAAPRTELLAMDLRILGVEHPAGLDAMPGLAAADADGARHGLVYVVEGSALGGTVLARIVRERLGLGPDDGAAFLGAGASTPGRWRQVKAALERDADGPRTVAAQRAAADAFDVLAAWTRSRGLTRTPGTLR